ncbi:unnamed protein product [Orchesella dallaii]|uniref:Uncharacterized protein n=1 Tax=Orchesella dallaii TaxID=48710 RepID=A0ABP1Q3C7_9HEXA
MRFIIIIVFCVTLLLVSNLRTCDSAPQADVVLDGMVFRPSQLCPNHDNLGHPCWADRNRRDSRCIFKGYNRRWDFKLLGNKCYCCGPYRF